MEFLTYLSESDGRPGRKPYLDGLRGWASLMVMGCHVVRPSLPRAPYGPMLNGPLSVAVFFAVSGFSLMCVGWKDGARVCRSAVARVPRLAIPVTAHCLVDVALFPSRWAADLAAPLVLFFPATGLWQHQPPRDLAAVGDVSLRHWSQLWTMSIELNASMAIFMWLLVKPHVHARAWWYAPAYCLAYACNPSYSYFVLGAGLQDLFAARAPEANGIVAVAFLFVAAGICFLPSVNHWITNALQSLSVASCFAALAWSPRFQALLSGKLSTFLGRVSFSLYLCHVYVLRATMRVMTPGTDAMGEAWGFENKPSPGPLSAGTAAIAAAAALAWATVMTAVDRWAIRVSRQAAAWVVSEEAKEGAQSETTHPLLSVI